MPAVGQASARYRAYITCSNDRNPHVIATGTRSLIIELITLSLQVGELRSDTMDSIARMQTILVIDDDESLRDTIGVMLEQEGFRAVLVADGRAGYEKSLLLKPDLILVDLRLPGMNGVEICKQLRAAQVVTPIIVLSALGDEIDKVLLLEIGADDYLVKPFGTRELLARIRAVLRRTSPEARKVVHFSEVEVDLERRVVTRRGEELKLTPAEYNLLTYFLQNPDRPLTRDMILNSVWGYEFFPNTRTVDAHVVKLRQKLEPEPNVPRHFLTVHGVGYRFLP
jgi:DNA-binding response OmpR family regulator